MRAWQAEGASPAFGPRSSPEEAEQLFPALEYGFKPQLWHGSRGER